MSPRARAVLAIVLAAPGLIPLLFPYLPFQGWPGHVGAVGAVHWASLGQLPSDYAVRSWLGPNRLFYALAAALAPLTGVQLASNLVLAVFLGGFGPSVALLIRLSGGDERWAVLVLPLTLGRILACGFGCNAMALTPLCLGIAALLWLPRAPLRASVAFIAAALVTLGLHAFVFYVLWGFAALAGAYFLARKSSRRAGYACVSAWLGLAVATRFFGHYGEANYAALAKAVFDSLELRGPSRLAATFWEWLFAYHRTARLDDVAQVCWGGGIVVGIARRLGTIRRSPELILLSLCLTASLAVFVILPEGIGPPVNWWGGNLRIPIVAAILLITLAARPGDTFTGYALGFGGAAGLVFFLFTSARIADFSQKEMAGFDSLLEQIPAQRRVCAVHFSDAALHEFPGEPHWYVANYYLARKPGLVSANLFGNSGEIVGRNSEVPQPGWGVADSFDWNTHFAWCDYLLVRHSPAEDYAPPPRTDAVALTRSARWVLIAKTRSEEPHVQR